jgi:hypothetical protein
MLHRLSPNKATDGAAQPDVDHFAVRECTLTMRTRGQPVATHGNGFRAFEPFWTSL